jgi:hypothetical protein
MQHLIHEGDEAIGQSADAATRDAMMIAAAQKVEHYEIATYGTARTWANLLGHSQVAALLERTLDEEKATDQKLTGIAESHINQEAAEKGSEPAATREEPGRRSPARRSTPRARAHASDRGMRMAGRTGGRPRGRSH